MAPVVSDGWHCDSAKSHDISLGMWPKRRVIRATAAAGSVVKLSQQGITCQGARIGVKQAVSAHGETTADRRSLPRGPQAQEQRDSTFPWA